VLPFVGQKRWGKIAMKLAHLVVALVLSLSIVGWSRAASIEASEFETSVPGGQIFTQTAVEGGGYRVTDDNGVSLWTAFQGLGGVDRFGYPISQRLQWNGSVSQFFQKGVLHLDPKSGQIAIVNLFDDLHNAGYDDPLLHKWGIPSPEWLPNEGQMSWPEIVAGRKQWLDGEPRFRQFYDSFPDALSRFGLPTSRVYDAGAFLALRTQRATLQFWKTDQPWAKAGMITVVNGGDLAKELGLISSEALEPEPLSPSQVMVKPVPSFGPCQLPAPTRGAPGRPIIALDPGHGGTEIGSTARFGDGFTLAEKAANLQIGHRTAALLREAGFGVVMTRTADTQVNVGRCDATGDGRVGLDDDLQVRVDTANAAGAAVFVSIHNNGHSNRDQRGAEVYYSASHPLLDRNRHLASLLQSNIVASMRAAGYPVGDRGIRTDQSINRRFFVLSPRAGRVTRPIQMPAALGESLFLTNPADSAALRRPEIIDAIARGYVQGIRAFLGQ
jgi:N-acetylmuramoyl-L-alanine amidase